MKPDTSARQVERKIVRDTSRSGVFLARWNGVRPRMRGHLACTQRYDPSRERGHRALTTPRMRDALALWQTAQIGNEHHRIARRVLPDVMSSASRQTSAATGQNLILFTPGSAECSASVEFVERPRGRAPAPTEKCEALLSSSFHLRRILPAFYHASSIPRMRAQA